MWIAATRLAPPDSSRRELAAAPAGKRAAVTEVRRRNEAKPPVRNKRSRPISGILLRDGEPSYDSHSSGRRIAPSLEPPTRALREQRQRAPIWCCSGWRLPRFTRRDLHCGDSSLWPCSSPWAPARADTCCVRPLAVTLLYGVPTFLPRPEGRERLSGRLRAQGYSSGRRCVCVRNRVVLRVSIEVRNRVPREIGDHAIELRVVPGVSIESSRRPSAARCARCQTRPPRGSSTLRASA